MINQNIKIPTLNLSGQLSFNIKRQYHVFGLDKAGNCDLKDFNVNSLHFDISNHLLCATLKKGFPMLLKSETLPLKVSLEQISVTLDIKYCLIESCNICRHLI